MAFRDPNVLRTTWILPIQSKAGALGAVHSRFLAALTRSAPPSSVAIRNRFVAWARLRGPALQRSCNQSECKLRCVTTRDWPRGDRFERQLQRQPGGALRRNGCNSKYRSGSELPGYGQAKSSATVTPSAFATRSSEFSSGFAFRSSRALTIAGLDRRCGAPPFSRRRAGGGYCLMGAKRRSKVDAVSFCDPQSIVRNSRSVAKQRAKSQPPNARREIFTALIAEIPRESVSAAN